MSHSPFFRNCKRLMQNCSCNGIFAFYRFESAEYLFAVVQRWQGIDDLWFGAASPAFIFWSFLEADSNDRGQRSFSWERDQRSAAAFIIQQKHGEVDCKTKEISWQSSIRLTPAESIPILPSSWYITKAWSIKDSARQTFVENGPPFLGELTAH